MKAKVKRTVFYGLAFMASKWTIIFLLYHSGFWSYWFLLLFPIADTIAAILAIIYLKGNFKKYFAQILEDEYPEDFAIIISETDTAYGQIKNDIEFVQKSKNPLDKRINFAGYFLALIRVLEKKGESFDTIRKVSLGVAKEYIKPKNRIHHWYLLLVPKLVNTALAKRFLAKLHKKVSVQSHSNGFQASVLTSKKETNGFGYGIDIVECGICKLFKQKNESKYLSILCEVDHLTSEIAGLQLVRTSTIAQGASHCDFRFQKI